MTDAAEYRRHAQDALARDNLELAVVYLQNAVRQDPHDRESHLTLGRLLRLAGQGERATACYRACLERFPGDSVTRMGLAALGQKPAPDRLPDEVVLYVFDRNARAYESNYERLRIQEAIMRME
ncbi:MAG: tetratricopeptide repeat protein [Alphaproteobacteria bacterium]|nr:tetratricopeptide repeat protein [Alphaproteobacteria bacterium]